MSTISPTTSMSVSSIALDMTIKAQDLHRQNKQKLTLLTMDVESTTDLANAKNSRQYNYKAFLQGFSSFAMTAIKITAAVSIHKDKLDPIADLGLRYSTDGLINFLDGRSAQIGGVVQRGRSNEDAHKKATNDDQFLQAHNNLMDIANKRFQCVSA